MSKRIKHKKDLRQVSDSIFKKTAISELVQSRKESESIVKTIVEAMTMCDPTALSEMKMMLRTRFETMMYTHIMAEYEKLTAKLEREGGNKFANFIKSANQHPKKMYNDKATLNTLKDIAENRNRDVNFIPKSINNGFKKAKENVACDKDLYQYDINESLNKAKQHKVIAEFEGYDDIFKEVSSDTWDDETYQQIDDLVKDVKNNDLRIVGTEILMSEKLSKRCFETKINKTINRLYDGNEVPLEIFHVMISRRMRFGHFTITASGDGVIIGETEIKDILMNISSPTFMKHAYETLLDDNISSIKITKNYTIQLTIGD